jgi:hypothetical protein
MVFSNIILKALMAYPRMIQALDRLSVQSVMRGSTSTLCGVLGTVAVLVLCLVFYIPAARDWLAGDYFESEFLHQAPVSGKFYSNRDFKIAVQFRSRADNSVANHSTILEWASS